MSRRIVVGVDPGLRHTGLAVAEEHSLGSLKTVFLVAMTVIDFTEQRMIAQRFATVLASIFQAIEKKYAQNGTLFFPGDKTEGLRWATPRILGFSFHLAIETQNITRGAFKSDQTIQVASALKEGFDMVLFQRYQTQGTVSAHRLVDWWVKTRKAPRGALAEQRRQRKEKRIERMMEMTHQPLFRSLFGAISEHVADAVLLVCAGCGIKYGADPAPVLHVDILRALDGTKTDGERGLWVHKLDYSVRFADGGNLATSCRVLCGDAFESPEVSPSGSEESSRSTSDTAFFAQHPWPKDGSSSTSSSSSGSDRESSCGASAEGSTSDESDSREAVSSGSKRRRGE